MVTPDMLTQMAHDVGETSILSRTGGAPTLAVGMASILSSFLGGAALMGVWYHFIILFEALFILTTVDAGTRVLRFMIQDYVGAVVPAFKDTKSWANNLIGSAVACALWGYLLYAASSTPTAASTRCGRCSAPQPDAGGDRAHPLHGDPVQDEARALRAGHHRRRPCGSSDLHGHRGAGEGLLPDPAIGFVTHALKFGGAAAAGKMLAPAKTLDQMGRVVFNDYVDAALAAAAVGDRSDRW